MDAVTRAVQGGVSMLAFKICGVLTIITLVLIVLSAVIGIVAEVVGLNTRRDRTGVDDRNDTKDLAK